MDHITTSMLQAGWRKQLRQHGGRENPILPTSAEGSRQCCKRMTIAEYEFITVHDCWIRLLLISQTWHPSSVGLLLLDVDSHSGLEDTPHLLKHALRLLDRPESRFWLIVLFFFRAAGWQTSSLHHMSQRRSGAVVALADGGRYRWRWPTSTVVSQTVAGRGIGKRERVLDEGPRSSRSYVAFCQDLQTSTDCCAR